MEVLTLPEKSADVVSKEITHKQLKHLEQLIAENLETTEFPLQHDFIDGVYIRTLFFPEGSLAVGKIHATKHMFILAKGRVISVSEDGGRKEIVAGDVFVCDPGMKRACYALEDTVMINIHTNKDNDQDLARLEAKLITPEAIGYDKKEELVWRG